MIDASVRGQGDGPAVDTQDIRRVFICRVHQVLQQGYVRLDAVSHQSSAEPAITGELVRSMRLFLSDASAPDWADHFAVHDDPAVNDGIRLGKDRNRIDIRVDSATPRPGTSFSFEAKRLASGFPVSKYLGREGLGCFLSGEYARDDDDAGMIGYVQENDTAVWTAAIQDAIEADSDSYEVTDVGALQTHRFPGGPLECFASVHTRKAVGRPIMIYHSLLLFWAGAA